MIDEIIQLEWEQFDKVQNVGGRANCQDDFKTFYIMRHSQFALWSAATLASYKQDLEEANAIGRNLITEKYAHMMASTAPEEYAQIKDRLPIPDEKTQAIIEAVVAIEVGWMEDFYARHPELKDKARYIHQSEDDLEHTSSETYLRGELMTYSGTTLARYARDVIDYYHRGENMIEKTVENELKAYGYQL